MLRTNRRACCGSKSICAKSKLHVVNRAKIARMYGMYWLEMCQTCLPKAPKICPHCLRGTLDNLGNVPRAVVGRSGTVSERSRSLPGGSKSIPEALLGVSGTSRGRSMLYSEEFWTLPGHIQTHFLTSDDAQRPFFEGSCVCMLAMYGISSKNIRFPHDF